MTNWRREIGAATLYVPDLGEARKFYSAVFGSGPADRDWGMRTATFADPGGHIWEIAQELPSADG